MTKHKLINGFRGLVTTGLVSLLVACGGGSGNDDSSASSESIVARGVITQLGSIWVLGVEYETPKGGSYSDDDNVSDEAHYKVGQWVRIRGTRNDDSVSGTATEVEYEAEIEGAALGGAINGVTIIFTSNTNTEEAGNIIALNDGSRYDPVANSWTAMTANSAPTARSRHTAVWTGSEMIVWGGSKGSWVDVLNDGGRYSPAADSWTAMTMTAPPAARSGHTAVWSGGEMIVWGGSAGLSYFDDTFIYFPARALYLYQKPVIFSFHMCLLFQTTYLLIASIITTIYGLFCHLPEVRFLPDPTYSDSHPVIRPGSL